MKKTVITIAALLVAFVSFADTVDRSQAESIAKRWLGSEVTEAGYESDAMYIFNGKDGGWIIISAEDATTPVLGYNETGRINPRRLPDNFKHWVGGYEKSVKAVRANRVKASSEVEALWKTAGYRTKASSKKVLETALWDQESPYNDQCPMVTESGREVRAVTGCVATAMSEVIRYHKWPERGKGTIGGYSYTSDVGKKVEIPEYSIDSHTYDYSLMPLTYNGAENSAQKAAVAQLMHDCGVMVSANYNYNTGTGAFSEEIVNALVQHMSYSASAQLVYRYSYTDAEWTRLIEAEIDGGRPIIYGANDAKEGGHQFVCDGYDERDYIRINWGWSGDGNGFFTLMLKIPGQFTFSEGHDMVINLAPDREGDDVAMAGPLVIEAYDSNSKGLTVASGSILSKSFKLSIDCISNVNYYVDYDGAVKAALVDWEGNIKEFISAEATTKIGAYQIIRLNNLVCTIKGDVTFGDRVVLYYKDSAGNWTQVKGKESYDYSQDQYNPTTMYMCSSVPAVDAAFILIPEDLKDGDTFFFEMIPGATPIKTVSWYYDGNQQSGVSANLTAGSHTVRAEVTYRDGSQETLNATLLVR